MKNWKTKQHQGISLWDMLTISYTIWRMKGWVRAVFNGYVPVLWLVESPEPCSIRRMAMAAGILTAHVCCRGVVRGGNVAEPPKCLGPPTPVIVPRTSDSDAGDPPALEVRWASLDAHSTATCGVSSKLVLTTGNGQLTRTSSSRPYRIASGHLNTRITRCEDIAVSQTT